MTYLPQILALGQEEQRIVATRRDAQRLAEIERERARLWDLQRRLKAGAKDVPPPPKLPKEEQIECRPLPKLPAGVAWINYRPDRPLPSTVQACVYLSRHDKVYLSGFPATEEGIARAALAAAAGRAARDKGIDRAGIVGAMREAVNHDRS